MPFDADIPKKQVIAILGLAVRDSSGVPTYGTSLGDQTYADDEIDRAVQSGMTAVGKTIAETDGHHHRPLFETSTALTHGAVIPAHIGSPGVPRITPYSGCTYTIIGKRKSIEEISAYRANPNFFYSEINHTTSQGGMHSKLAGFYAIDKATNVIYFTGFSAVADLATFTESQYTVLPDLYYPDVINLAIMFLKKDGDVSDIFSYHAELGMAGLAAIKNKESDQPSMKKTVGARDSGQK